jgi:hypothetical protein
MLELMPNDLTAVSSVTEGTVRWCPGDAYSQALENKPEYAGRVDKQDLAFYWYGVAHRHTIHRPNLGHRTPVTHHIWRRG